MTAGGAGPGAEDWDGFWGRPASRRFGRISWSKRRVLEMLRPYLRRGGRALDAGCGSGFYAAFFVGEGMTVTALDYAPAALASAGRLTGGRARLVRADLLGDDLESLLGPARYDLIFSDGLFEHFADTDQDRILCRLAARLSTTGTLVTVVPNRWSPWQIVRPWFMPGIRETPFVPARLRDLHVRNGLDVVAAGGLNVLPIRLSPEGILGSRFGMLLFTAARRARSSVSEV